MVMIEMKKYKCPECGKEYEDSVRSNFPGKPCGDCTKLRMKLHRLKLQLIDEEFSIEQEDVKIARQIHDLLVKESSGSSENDKRLLIALTERLLTDEKRREKILKEISSLQKEKR